MSSTRLRLAAAALPFALALSACGGDAKDDASAPATAPATAAAPTQSAELAGVKVTGAGTAKPQLALPSTPFTTSGPGFRVLEEGSGAQIGGQDEVDAHYLLVNGKDGKQLDARFGQEVVGLSLADDTLQNPIRSAMVGLVKKKSWPAKTEVPPDPMKTEARGRSPSVVRVPTVLPKKTWPVPLPA